MIDTILPEPVKFGAHPILSGSLFVRQDVDVSTVLIFVHPWTWLGGRGAILDELAQTLAEKGHFACLTFDLRGAGKSGGWSTFTGNSEVHDVKAAVDFMHTRFPNKKTILVGYSAGACIGGSSASVCTIDGYVGIAYPCGLISSFAFWAHPKQLGKYEGPKLLIHGDNDGFTSSSQLLQRMGAITNLTVCMLPGAGHFDILGEPSIVEKIMEFARSP